MGWYNTTMYASKDYHYPNSTVNALYPGLFYLLPIKKLENPQAYPLSEGWGYPNWNFSVKASSGDSENVLNVSLYMGTTWPPIFKCEAPTCINQTPTECLNCINSTKYWYRNFTANDIGNWYYQFKMDGAETSQVLYVTVEKDDVNISYVEGNNSFAKYSPAQSAKFVVRVYDLDAQTYNLNPAATVTFRIKYNGLYDKIIGSNRTNSSGYAEFYFVPDCSFNGGDQYWYAQIDSSEPNYKPATSSEFNISLDVTGCIPQVQVQAIYNPREVFIYRNFTINATITTIGPQGTQAENVNVSIILPEGWQVDEAVKQVGTIPVGTVQKVWWNINATSYGEANVTVNATSSNAGMYTLISDKFVVYKLKPSSLPQESLPFVLQAGKEKIFSWQCEAGNYRIANLTISSVNLTTLPQEVLLRVYVYNGTDWLDILHNYKINLTSQRIDFVPILQNQLLTNETGYCTIKISNIGSNDINITGLTLEGYYNETVQIQDIQVKVNEAITTGLETSEELFNVTVKIANSNATAYSGTIWLNITNSSGYLVNYSSQPVTIPASSTVLINFININTSTWLQDTYSLRAYLIYDSKSTERTEKLIFKDIAVSSKSSNWMCNQTTEIYNATIYHPFTDNIQYNVTLEVPPGWSFSPSYQLVNASLPGNYTISFNLTSSNSASEIAIVNASVTYNYPGIQKSKKSSFTIQEGNSIAILEVIRETPKLVGGDKVFDSRLVVHNKGCAAASGAIVKEIVSTGWTPANPGIKTNEYGSSVQLISSSVDLVNNAITWQLGSIGVNEYAVLTYQIKSPPANSQQGGLRYNVSWEDKSLQEEKAFIVQTANYTQESHLVFDLDVLQQEEYPWSEPRSAQLNKNYNYSLKVTNVGDITASNWNVSLFVPQACNVTQVFNNGVWNEAMRQITWQLPDLDVYSSITLNFTANCSQEGKQVFIVKGIKDTRSTTTFVNNTSISCTGANCYVEQSFTFVKPSDARYEKLNEADFLINYEWKGQNVTIGQAFVNFADDLNNYRLAWQNYSLSSSSGKSWGNYSIDESEQGKFVLANRKIGIGSYTDATYGQDSNITIEKIAYTWNTGKLFEEEQELFAKIKTYSYAPLLTNATLYINGNSSLTTGGWGEEFNFSVMVRDRFGRDVTVYAWHKPVASTTWSLIGSWTCMNCLTWTQHNFTYDYQPADMGTWEFKFNASNIDGNSELSGYTYAIEKDDVDVYAIVPPQDSIVNRSEAATTFAIRVYDKDNKSYPTGSFGKIWIDVFTYGSYESSPPILTSDNGWLNRTMQGGAGTDKNVYWCSDTSKWYLGLHSWYGGTSGDTYVKDNVTLPINFTLKGDLSNSTMVAFTTNFTRGDTITFSGNVVDDCGVVQTDPAKFGLEFRMGQNGIVYGSCTTPTTSFSCSIATNENFPYGWYNITTIAFARGDLADKYWNGTKVAQNAFFLRSKILLEDARKIPAQTLVPWGKSPFNFTVNVTSPDNEAVTVYLWMRNSTHDWWLENSTTCSPCNNFYFFTSRKFTSDSISANSWYFKFNATSTTGYINDSLAAQSFDVTKDPITFTNFGGNNSFVNRSSEPNAIVNLTAQVWDLILNQNVLAPATPNITLDQIHFFVFNGSAYVENETEELRNDTDFVKQFNPDCSFIPGARYWNVSVSDSSAYEDNSTTGYVTLIVNVIGDLNATYIGPTGLVEYEIGSAITFSGNVTDECGNEISGATVEFRLENATHVKYVCTSTSTSNPYTCTFDTTGKDVGIYNVTMVASKPYYNNATDFEANAFKIKSTPKLRAADVSPRSEGWSKMRNFTINVTDNPGDTVTVYLWQRHPVLQPEWQQIGSAQTCSNCLNTVLWWNKTYSCSDVSPVAWEFKFNATDTEGNRYETTLTDYVYYASGNSNFFVEKDNVLLEYVEGNEVNATLEQEVPLVLRVYDIDNSSYVSSPSASVSYNLTKEGIGSSYYTLATNTTNATGYVTYYFKPDLSFLTTKQNWLGFIPSSDSCYQYNSSSVFNVTTWTNAPQFANVSVDIITQGWGIGRTFNVSVYDQNLTATVYLWRARSLSGPWILMNSSSYSTPGSWQSFSFYQTFSCEDQGTWYFKFNASNSIGNRNSTPEVATNNFTLTQDIILLEDIVGINSIANRSGNQVDLLGVRVRDLNGTLIPNLMVNFTIQLSPGVWGPVYGNLTNESGYAVFYFNPGCSPKYEVGDRIWKAYVAKETSECYAFNTTQELNLTIMGDIILEFSKPDGSVNYTQEQVIPFLGATTDDCGDALTTTVRFYANQSAISYNCTAVTQVGANAYTCDLPTSLQTSMGWYNATMMANRTYHYDNSTVNFGIPGLLYLFAKLKVEEPTGLPKQQGWGYSNWNFSVKVSSGHPTQVYNTSLLLSKVPPPTAKCDAPTCLNQTPTECLNCINDVKYWYRNFSYTEIGRWYYRYELDGTYSSFDAGLHYVDVTKDNVTLEENSTSYNDTAAVAQDPTKWAMFVIRVKDLIRDQPVDIPSALVSFYVTVDAGNTLWQFVGTNTTNSTGYAIFYFKPTCQPYFASGTRKWRAEINPSDNYYNYNISGEFDVNVDSSACVPSINIIQIKKPNEIFQNKTFGINVTLQAVQGDALDANVTILVPAGWEVWNTMHYSNVYYLGTIASGSIKDAHFDIKPNSPGGFSLTIYANATMGGEAKSDQKSTSVYIYKWLIPTQALESLPIVLKAGESLISSFNCEVGNYRIANLTISSTNLTTLPQEVLLRVYVYNGTDWLDILHNYKINLTSQRIDFVPILQNQLLTNETGYCTIKISNIGSNDINITGLTLEGYYNETVQIQDIQVKVNEAITTGLETSESSFNVTIRIANSLASDISGTLWLNITNSTGYLVNYSSQLITIPAKSFVLINFSNINTSTWLQNNYNIKAYLAYGSNSIERSEQLIFRNVVVSSKSSNWMCNQTTEIYNVTIYHPFNDFIQYNISLEVPQGWSYSPSFILVNASFPGNYTASFNLTSSNSESEIAIVNASVSYNYPGIQKSKKASFTIQESNSIAILEIIRETPKVIGNNRVFDSRLVVHNKGCAATSGTTIVKEIVSSGWTPANPGIKTNEYGNDIELQQASVDLVNNIITWQLGVIPVNKYAVLTYQIKSPTAYPAEGSLRYNVSWDDKSFEEESPFVIRTFNYTQESHLEFDLEAIQQPEFPWPEPRSAQINRNYNYSLRVTNVGDVTANNWNVTLTIPLACNVTQVFNSGIWNETTRKIIWQLPSLEPYASTTLNFTLNCSQEGKQVFVVEEIKDTRSKVAFVNETSIGCNGASCSLEVTYSFTKPTDARYEKLSEINFLINYNLTGYNVTIGQGFVNFTDDLSSYKIAWQNYSFAESSNEVWSNYSIDESEQEKFVLANRKIGISSYVDSSYNPQGSLSIKKIAYTWSIGKLFEEQQQLFTKIKTYSYAPLLENASLYINGESKNVGGWGEEFNFSVKVRDRFARNVTVYLWHKASTLPSYSDWQLIASWTCVNCDSNWIATPNFTFDYNQSHIDKWYFKFNASNIDGNTELYGGEYIVEKDDVNVLNITPGMEPNCL
jgi:hypothetical protein